MRNARDRSWRVSVALGTCLFTLGLIPNLHAGEYEYPIGIPAAPFGIVDSHEQYAGQLYEAGGITYRDAGNGPYTHYVDSNHPSCDNDQDYGTADKPLCDPFAGERTITLPPGSVMEIHGGPYRYDGWRRVVPQGTADSPVFIRSTDALCNRASLQGLDGEVFQLRIEGSYVVVENLEFFSGAYPRIFDGERFSHVAFRHLEVHSPVGARFNIGTALSADSASHVVIYNNKIHDNWRISDGDTHGTGAGSGSQFVWILDNEIARNSGDAFQACHRCFVNNGQTPPSHVYVGRNVMHDDRENAVDLKSINNVVISQNTMYGYTASSTSNGDAVVIGSNGVGETFDDGGPDNVWLLFNEIRDNQRGIRVEGVFNGYFVGNYVHNNATDGLAMDIHPNGFGDLQIVGNTFAANREHIHNHWRNGENQVLIENNVFLDATWFHVAMSDGLEAWTTLNNNLFWQNGGGPIYFGHGFDYANPGDRTFENRRYQIISGPTLVADAAASDAQFAGGADNVLGDPRFTGSGISAGSAAVDEGRLSALYALFESEFGESIQVDIRGLARPAGADWDIGAYEFNGGPQSHSKQSVAQGVSRGVSACPADTIFLSGFE